jgi:hypothetical protein
MYVLLQEVVKQMDPSEMQATVTKVGWAAGRHVSITVLHGNTVLLLNSLQITRTNCIAGCDLPISTHQQRRGKAVGWGGQ